MSRPSTSELDLSMLPNVICALDLETSGPNALKTDLTDLAVVDLKVYTWDEQQKGYLPGSYDLDSLLGGWRRETWYTLLRRVTNKTAIKLYQEIIGFVLTTYQPCKRINNFACSIVITPITLLILEITYKIVYYIFDQDHLKNSR